MKNCRQCIHKDWICDDFIEDDIEKVSFSRYRCTCLAPETHGATITWWHKSGEVGILKDTTPPGSPPTYSSYEDIRFEDGCPHWDNYKEDIAEIQVRALIRAIWRKYGEDPRPRYRLKYGDLECYDINDPAFGAAQLKVTRDGDYVTIDVLAHIEPAKELEVSCRD
jgi:hypothetical protein